MWIFPVRVTLVNKYVFDIVMWMNGLVTSLIRWVRKYNVGSSPTVTT